MSDNQRAREEGGHFSAALQDNQRAREEGGHFSAALHASFALLITTFTALVQMKYHSLDPFKEHYVILLTLILSLIGYVVSGALVIELRRRESNHDKIISKVNLFSGALTSISPVWILIPIVGWLLFAIWAASFAWVAYDSYADFKELFNQAKSKVSDIWKKLTTTEQEQNALPPSRLPV